MNISNRNLIDEFEKASAFFGMFSNNIIKLNHKIDNMPSADKELKIEL